MNDCPVIGGFGFETNVAVAGTAPGAFGCEAAGVRDGVDFIEHLGQ
jgi:hypothetical protein